MRHAFEHSSEEAARDLDETYRELSPWLHRRLLRVAGALPSDVDDIVQETFLRFGRCNVRDRGRHPRALLIRIASNLGTDAHRRAVVRKAGSHVALDDASALNAPSLVSPADQAFLIDLKRAVLELPDHLRDTFLLARFTPMTQREIAERQGISTKAVEWRIKQAVSICLERLER